MSQIEKIKQELLREKQPGQHGKWRRMPDLVRVSGSYNIHSRIAELRDKPHYLEIENCKGPGTDGIENSWYRIRDEKVVEVVQ